MHRAPLAAVAALGLLAAPALAQDADEPTVEESAILPSAEDHEESEAPTMHIDCEADPASCDDPLETATEGPALSTPDDPATPAVEASEGEEVTTRP